MQKCRRPGLTGNDVTDPSLFRERRRFIQTAVAVLGSAWAGRVAWPAHSHADDIITPASLNANGETPNSLKEITSYNNYYEFSTDKEAVRILARALTTNPWSVTVEGEVENPLTLNITDLQQRYGQQERIYRLRCVEGWSMVIPWNGFPLRELLKEVKPTADAHYVEFVSLQRSSEMINQRHSTLAWPYREGLRLDEAMHPLSFVATGIYGDPLPKQNGAPLRIVVPWKYGFKSSKAITHIRLLREQPQTSWAKASPSEYGFYANVNPDVSHPRWSQSREVRIGEIKKRPTLPFNGYAEEVAHLYQGMDLQRFF